MSFIHRVVVLALAGAAAPALAGPPYLTDDPVPTEKGHWEIYAFTAGEGRRSDLNGESGFDFNYGPVEGVQLTGTVPLNFSHAPAGGWRSGTGDLELGAKYRFFHDEAKGLSASIFPRAILPTASHSPGERTRFLIPLWIGKDFPGGTSIFGGGGYTLNPGPGNRNFWQASAAATKEVSKTVSLGVEFVRQGPDSTSGTVQTRAGIGTVVQLSHRYAMLFSGGPTWADHETSYHFYGALGLNF